jgi:type IV pilus assembly protein PilA
MLNWINRKMKRKGFTLIELVIVIAILGILIAIAVPRLTGFRDNAVDMADKATMETIAKAAELYVASNDAVKPTDNNPGIKIKDLVSAKLLEDEPKPQKEGETGFTLNYQDGQFVVDYEEESQDK